MAKLFDLEGAWHDWVASRPKVIQEMAARCPPNLLYRLKTTGQRVTLLAYSEDGTVRVQVSAEFNLLTMERSVFGIPIESLEECDLPQAEEHLGSILSCDEVEAALDGVEGRAARMQAVRDAAEKKLAG